MNRLDSSSLIKVLHSLVWLNVGWLVDELIFKHDSWLLGWLAHSKSILLLALVDSLLALIHGDFSGFKVNDNIEKRGYLVRRRYRFVVDIPILIEHICGCSLRLLGERLRYLGGSYVRYFNRRLSVIIRRFRWDRAMIFSIFI